MPRLFSADSSALHLGLPDTWDLSGLSGLPTKYKISQQTASYKVYSKIKQKIKITAQFIILIKVQLKLGAPCPIHGSRRQGGATKMSLKLLNKLQHLCCQLLNNACERVYKISCASKRVIVWPFII